MSVLPFWLLECTREYSLVMDGFGQNGDIKVYKMKEPLYTQKPILTGSCEFSTKDLYTIVKRSWQIILTRFFKNL